MPAELSGLTLAMTVAAIAVVLLALPLVLLIAGPALLVKLAFARRAPAGRRGGYYAIR